MNNLVVINTLATNLEAEEQETLQKSISPFELIQSNRVLKYKSGYNPGKYNAQIYEMTCDYAEGRWHNAGDQFPSIVGLARYLKVSDRTIHNWRADVTKPEFSDIVDVLLSEQERIAFNKGSTGEMQSVITKIILTHRGYHDRVEHAGIGGGPIDMQWTTIIVDPKLEDNATD